MNHLNELIEGVWNDLREGVAEVLGLFEDVVDSDPSVYRGDVDETEGPPEDCVDPESGQMTADQYRREMWHWGRRVRRDILALEAWALSQDPGFEPGGSEAEDPGQTSARIDELAARQREQDMSGDEAGDGMVGDPGDPPGGPPD
jgi:hypothetical protein